MKRPLLQSQNELSLMCFTPGPLPARIMPPPAGSVSDVGEAFVLQLHETDDDALRHDLGLDHDRHLLAFGLALVGLGVGASPERHVRMLERHRYDALLYRTRVRPQHVKSRAVGDDLDLHLLTLLLVVIDYV